MKLVIESVYILISPQFSYRAKIGISNSVKSRRASIAAELRGRFGGHVKVYGFGLPIVTNARSYEIALHEAVLKLTAWRCNTMKGTNGGTEWFIYINGVSALLAGLIAWGFGLPCVKWVMLTALLIPLPLDFALCLLLLAAVEYAAVAGGVYLIYNLLT